MKAWIVRHRVHMVVVGCICLVVGLAGWWKWQQRQAGKRFQQKAAAQSAEDQLKYVQVYRVESQRFQDALSGLMGTIKSSSLELKGTQEEVLTRYFFKPGDFIRKGQTIAEQDHLRTRSKLRQAEIALKRKQSLFNVGGASRTELEEAQEILSLAKKDYDDTFVRAPKNGRLGEILVQEGELVNRQSPIAYFVSDEDYYYVELSVIEKHFSEISIGQKARVDVPSVSAEPILGHVISVSPEITTSSRMIPVRVKLDQQFKSRLRPGLSATCSLVIHDQESTVIPTSALLEQTASVLVVGEDRTVSTRQVKIGYQSRDHAAVQAGLRAGELIVMRPAYADVKPGEKIRYGKPERYGQE